MMTRQQMFRNIFKNAGAARFVAQLRSDQIFLSKIVGGKAVTLHLMFVAGGLEIKPAVYRYSCSNSHYDYSQGEMRWTRRKSVFIAVVKLLKKSNVWDKVQNKDFFVPNKNNKKALAKAKKAYRKLEM